MLGRDEDLTKLSRAVIDDDPQSMSPALASGALLAAVRLGRVDLVPALFDSLDAERKADALHVHPVWHLAEPLLTGAPDPELARFLGRIVRNARYERDAKLAARALSRAVGSEAAASLLTRLMEEAPNDGAKRELADELTRY
jgi:hypothetical protein